MHWKDKIAEINWDICEQVMTNSVERVHAHRRSQAHKFICFFIS